MVQVSESNQCVTHDWWLEDDEKCPVCQGIGLERERIIALPGREIDAMRASRSPSDWEQSYGIDIAIALIKGENE